LNLFEEMRFVRGVFPELSPAVVLELGTLRGAEALGRDARYGTLEPGKLANLALLALPESDSCDPYELLFDAPPIGMKTIYRGSLQDVLNKG
jgi:imidazolonepropionase-like amidohydrolase